MIYKRPQYAFSFLFFFRLQYKSISSLLFCWDFFHVGQLTAYCCSHSIYNGLHCHSMRIINIIRFLLNCLQRKKIILLALVAAIDVYLFYVQSNTVHKFRKKKDRVLLLHLDVVFMQCNMKHETDSIY